MENAGTESLLGPPRWSAKRHNARGSPPACLDYALREFPALPLGARGGYAETGSKNGSAPFGRVLGALGPLFSLLGTSWATFFDSFSHLRSK